MAPRVVGIAFGLLALTWGLVVWSEDNLNYAPADVSNWPTAVGQVADFESKRVVRGSKGISYTETKYDLVYEYMVPPQPQLSNFVNSRPHSSNWVRLGTWWSGHSCANSQDRDKYPVGSKVTVHWCPDNPDKAILEPYTAAQRKEHFEIEKLWSIFFIFIAALLMILPFWFTRESKT